jgi:predicted CoA-binding protein/GNAT superfamily N-acetyltransferase
MTETLSLRRLGPADAAWLAPLARTIWLAHYPAIISLAQIEYMLEARYTSAVLDTALRDPDASWFGLFAGPQAAGFAALTRQTDHAWLDKLYVHPDRQRSGLGARLLAACEAQTHDWQLPALRLRVNRHNTQALAAYRQYGLRITGTDTLDIGHGFFMDDYLLEKTLRFCNPDNACIAARIRQLRSVAVLGLSPQPERPSHRVAAGLQALRLRILPVRPGLRQVLGEPVWPRLEDLPEIPDMLCIFRNAEALPAIVDTALRLGLPALWAQQGIHHEAAALRAVNAGAFVVTDRCLWRDALEVLT